jgi:valyl-tRNA synthetase
MRWVMDVISAIRNVRGERNITPAKPLPVLLQGDNARERDWLAANRREIETLARTASLDWVANDAAIPESALTLVGDCKVLLPLGALIDRDAELKRLATEIDKTQNNLDRAEAKLANREFRGRAPPNIIEQEEARVREFAAAIAMLREQRERVEKMP